MAASSTHMRHSMLVTTGEYQRHRNAYDNNHNSGKELCLEKSDSQTSITRLPSHSHRRSPGVEEVWDPFPNKSRNHDKQKDPKSRRWFSSVVNWLKVSEPSADAMKKYKRDTYAHHGINLKDSRAAAKMHFPIGKVPKEAITSTSGPSPEEHFKSKFSAVAKRYSIHGVEAVSTPSLSDGPSAASVRSGNPVAPWQ